MAQATLFSWSLKTGICRVQSVLELNLSSFKSEKVNSQATIAVDSVLSVIYTVQRLETEFVRFQVLTYEHGSRVWIKTYVITYKKRQRWKIILKVLGRIWMVLKWSNWIFGFKLVIVELNILSLTTTWKVKLNESRSRISKKTSEKRMPKRKAWERINFQCLV